MKLTKKLFMSIMTLALVVVTLSASTFAWFTLGNTAEIEDFTVNVQTGTGMEISKDGTGWKNRINITEGMDNELQHLEFTAVTSFDGVNFYDADKGALTGANAAANTKYFEASFFVRVTKNTEGHASFNGVSLESVTGRNVDPDNVNQEVNYEDDDNKWTADVALAAGAYGENSPAFVYGNLYAFDALNAVKISFTDVTKTTSTSKLAYAFENDYSWGGMPTIDDVDLDGDGPNAAVKQVTDGLAKAYADAKLFDMSKAQPSEAGATAFPTYVKNSDITAANAITLGENPSQEDQATKAKTYVLVKTDFVNADTAKADGGILAGQTNLDDNYVYAKVTIRIWVDGWDADGINAILSQKTIISFKLKAN